MRTWMILPFTGFLLCLLVVTSLMLGRYPLSPGDITGFFLHWIHPCQEGVGQDFGTIRTILINIRLPRIIAAILIGAALSVSGATLQAMFNNPLVSPSLLGVLAGASFGAAMGMLYGKSWFAVQFGAFAFGLLAVIAALCIASIYRGDRLLMLILGGIISGSFFTALLSVIKYLADPYDELPAIVYWLMGGLSMVESETVWLVLFPMLAGIVLLIAFSGYINVLSMGDEEARALGLNVRFIRLLLIFAATFISALTVVLGGMIGWVGLIIPHIARMLAGPDNRILLPAAALIGSAYLLVVDDLSRLLFAVEIPIGILTTLVGIPFFALVLNKAKKGWS